MDNLIKIIPDHLLAEIFFESNNRIELGFKIGYNPLLIQKLMNVWVPQLDKLIRIELNLNAAATSWRYKRLKTLRGITYEEFLDLHNSKIIEEDFVFYPAFQYLNSKNGGIITSKIRTDFINKYSDTVEGYAMALESDSGGEVVECYFKKWQEKVTKLSIKKLFSHACIIAPTGSGKTVLLESILYNLTKTNSNYSTVLIDPHGDIGKKVIFHRHLKQRIVYINPCLKKGYSPIFNPFELKEKSKQNITYVAEQIIKSFEDVLNKDSQYTEVMINMLEKIVYFLLGRKSSTVTDFISILRAEKKITTQAESFNPFFNEYYKKPSNKTREALVNRIDRLLNAPLLHDLLTGKSTFDLERAVNSNKVIVFDLSELGPMSQAIFGKLILAHLKFIIQKRRKPSTHHTFCLLDEAHIFIGDKADNSIDHILTQLRGFGLHLLLSFQYVQKLGQLFEAVKHNTAIKIAGGGKDNVDDICKILSTKIEIELSDFEFYLKVRGRDIEKFKSFDFLLRNENVHFLNEIEQEELLVEQLEQYYKEIDAEYNEAAGEEHFSENILDLLIIEDD